VIRSNGVPRSEFSRVVPRPEFSAAFILVLYLKMSSDSDSSSMVVHAKEKVEMFPKKEKRSEQFRNVFNDINDYNIMVWNQNKMLVYAFSALMYIGIQIALFAVNFKDTDFIEEHYYLPFHLLEFWAVFVFTVIEGFVLLSKSC
jgi:hypothetical protein